jgi:hypothetical protein
MALVGVCRIHESEIVGEGEDAVSKVNHIEKQVGEGAKFGVKLTLLDLGMALVGARSSGEIREDFHEADAVAVAQVVEVLETLLLFGGILIVVTELLESFTNHVLTLGEGASLSRVLPLTPVKCKLSSRLILGVLLVKLNQVNFDGRVTGLCAFKESLFNTVVTVEVNFFRVGKLTVFVLEYFVLNKVLEVFVHLSLERALNKLVELGVQITFVGHILKVQE